MSDNPIESFHQQAKELEKGVKALLLDVRAYLDQNEEGEFYTAESDLYDAMESLQDFADSCEGFLADKSK